MEHRASEIAPGTKIGRYEIITQIASGGMASVYLARVVAVGGFNRLVALKRPHPHTLPDERIVAMFMDEARLAARIRHPNVVSTLDLEQTGSGEFFMVMEYIEGNGLNNLLERAAKLGQRIPTPLALRIMVDLLHGLHAAHELRDEHGVSLGLVHRDVSPHNVLVGVDGLARISDFGVAHARERLSSTGLGEIKGKFAYMAPEQITGGPVDRRADIFACGAVLWECLAGRRLFPESSNVSSLLLTILNDPLPDLRLFRSDLASSLYDAVYRALQRDPAARYQDAMQFAEALEAVGEKVGIFGPRVVGQWVKALSGPHLERLRKAMGEKELQVKGNPTSVSAIPSVRITPSPDKPAVHLPPFPLPLPKAVSHQPPSVLPWATPPPPPAVPHAQKERFKDAPPSGTAPGARAALSPPGTSPGYRPLPQDATLVLDTPLLSGMRTSTLGYLEHFGLSAPPFNDVRLPELFWQGGPFAEAMGTLEVAITNGRDPILLLGASGSGRTFSVEVLRYSVPGLKVFPVEPGLLFGVSPLLDLCRRLGIAAPEQVSTEMLMGIFLEGVRVAEPNVSRVLIALDNFSPDDPDLVQELLRIARAAPSMVHILLVGSPDLPDQLWAQGASELLSARAAQVDLRALNLKEMQDYIQFRLRAASDGFCRVDLSPVACQLLHARSEGLPRLVNVYLHNALLIAYLRETHEISIDTIRLAMKSRNYLTLSAAAGLLTTEDV